MVSDRSFPCRATVWPAVADVRCGSEATHPLASLNLPPRFRPAAAMGSRKAEVQRFRRHAPCCKQQCAKHANRGRYPLKWQGARIGRPCLAVEVAIAGQGPEPFHKTELAKLNGSKLVGRVSLKSVQNMIEYHSALRAGGGSDAGNLKCLGGAGPSSQCSLPGTPPGVELKCDGRSPDLRVLAGSEPSRTLCPVVFLGSAHRLQLRGQLRHWLACTSRTAFPLNPAAETVWEPSPQSVKRPGARCQLLIDETGSSARRRL